MPERTPSMRQRLLVWVAIPLLALVLINAWASYRAALQTAQTAYDRLLVTAAHALADLIWLEDGELPVTLPHAALEMYADALPGNTAAAERSPLIYRVSFLDGSFLAGEAAIPPYQGLPAFDNGHAARLKLYDTELHEQPMRMAALWQPVESAQGLQYVVVQVGEYAAHRYAIGRQILWQNLWQQSALLLLVLLTLWVGSTMTLRPLHQLARRLEQRKADDITPLPEQQAPREMQPMVQAFNGLIARIGLARQQQQRFVADASHQMRTPLAVLQLHAEAGLKGDISAQEALQDIARTTQRTTRLIHQLLMWNRAQQTAHAAADTVDLCALLQDVVVEQSPLLAQKGLDFALDAQPLTWYGEAWMLQEIVMNLLRNAITHTPAQGALGIRLTLQEKAVAICVWDSGPGLSPQMQQELFTPFVSESHQGVGLGLTISRDLAQACGGSLVIRNRVVQGKIAGVDAMLWLPHTARA